MQLIRAFLLRFFVVEILGNLPLWLRALAVTNIMDQCGISEVVFGVILLTIATTLPEKFV